MESIQGTKFESEDFISNMPDNVITNILDRLPIQEAVGTSILSKRWRFSWTTLTQLVFDYHFMSYLVIKNRVHVFYRKKLGQVLLQHKGSLTKFVLYTPGFEEAGIPRKEYELMYADIADDINHWIRFLSTKRLKELELINMCRTPLHLFNRLLLCLELKYLYLRGCCLRLVPGLHCFKNLTTFDFEELTTEGCRFGEFITCFPLLESLEYTYGRVVDGYENEVKLVEIGRLQNLKNLAFSFSVLDQEPITSSDFFRCMGFLTKLEELYLDFENCTSLVEVDVRNTSYVTLLPCLKTLSLSTIYLRDQAWMFCACGLINGSPNLQTLMIWVGDHDDDDDDDDGDDEAFPTPTGSLDIRSNLQLRNMMLHGITCSKIEIFLIKSLLASSPLLEKMVISKWGYVDNTRWCTFGEKLLKLPRASPVAEINLMGGIA